MVGVIAGIIGTLAVGAWVVAVLSAIQIVGLVPAGQRLRSWFTLGWWQFDKLKSLGGPGVEPLIKRYITAFGVFFLAVIGGIVLSFFAAMSEKGAPPGEQANEPRRINDWRVIAVRTAEALPEPGYPRPILLFPSA